MKRKKILFNICLFCLVTLSSTLVSAKTFSVTASWGLRLREKPTTNSRHILTISENAVIYSDGKLENIKDPNCQKGWLKTSYNGYSGYVCSDYTLLINEQTFDGEMSHLTPIQFEEYLNKQGFPESYKKELRKLHATYPNWIFIKENSLYNTWDALLNEEDISGRSLIYSRDGGYLSTRETDYNWETNTFYEKDAGGAYQANRATIAHYMDPRLYLNENNIFAFESLTYNAGLHKESLVKSILPDYLKDNSSSYMKAGQTYNLSPIFLASKSRQELGTNPNYPAMSGHAGFHNGTNYDGYYNAYNIGASSGTAPVYNGLQHAKNKGWTSRELAIIGGAQFLGNSYIKVGQDTSYYQKWNAKNERSWHQYMTDIKGLIGISQNTKKAYLNYGVLNAPFVFLIPVFNNMSQNITPLPPKGNPNNWLKSLNIDNNLVPLFKGDTYNYNLKYDKYKETINITASPIASTSSITGLGTKTLKEGNNKFIITVIAQNQDKRNYTLNIYREKKDPNENQEQPNTNNEHQSKRIEEIIKESNFHQRDEYLTNIGINRQVASMINEFKKIDNNIIITIKNKDGSLKTSGNLGTGDLIIIKKEEETKTYKALIYGDHNGKSTIGVIDLLKVQKTILGYETLNREEKLALDINRDNKISVMDLLLIQKHILNYLKIDQS